MPSIQVLISSEPDDEVGKEILSAAIPGIELVGYAPDLPRLSDSQCEAAVLIPPYRGSHRSLRLLEQLPVLRMVQLLSAGVDEWAHHVPSYVTLASARGAHAGPVSEWVLSAVLAQLRRWPALVRFQDNEIWAHRRFDAETLRGRKVLIVGAGSIGMAVARKLEAFDAIPTLVASRARKGVHPASELHSLISGHLVVIITAPLTAQTRKLVDAQFLAAMDDEALLVNAGRGQIVDTPALVKELRSTRLRAALDVTDPEPLPPGHALWRSTGVIVSPHSARTVPGTNRLCYEIAAAQIRAFSEGDIPPNSVEHGTDPATGDGSTHHESLSG